MELIGLADYNFSIFPSCLKNVSFLNEGRLKLKTEDNVETCRP